MKRLLIMIALVCMSFISASAQRYVPAKEMYMYGVAISMTDSVAYITDVIQVNGAYRQKKTNFIYERTGYSAQFTAHMKSAGVETPTSVTVYDEKRSTLEKKYKKIKARLKKDGYLVKNIPMTEFQYTAIAYQE